MTITAKLAEGRLVDFKRQPGRGRPSLGKIISISPIRGSIRVETILGKIESIKADSILRVRAVRPTRKTKEQMIAERALIEA